MLRGHYAIEISAFIDVDRSTRRTGPPKHKHVDDIALINIRVRPVPIGLPGTPPVDAKCRLSERSVAIKDRFRITDKFLAG